MIYVAVALFITGLLVSLLGVKLFKVLLPLLGLVAGAVVGFVGFQAVFGTGAVSTTVAVFVAIVVGALLALTSYAFFSLAVVIYTALLGASAFAFLGVALGLENLGFLLFLLSVAGFVAGLVVASSMGFTVGLVTAVTSLSGVALILASVMLIVGDLSVDQLHQEGVIRAVIDVVDQSFLWLFAWLGGSLIAINVQRSMLQLDHLTNQYQFNENL